MADQRRPGEKIKLKERENDKEKIIQNQFNKNILKKK